MESDRLVNGMVFMSFEEKMARARELYMSAISESVNTAVDDFILVKDKLALVDDATLFTLFTLIIKRAELLGLTIELKPLVKQMKAIIGLMELELPQMLFEFARAAAEEKPAQGEVN